MRKLLLAALLMAVPSTAFAQLGGMGGGMGGMGVTYHRFLVKLETTSDKTVLGTLSLWSIPVESDLGIYLLDPAKVKSLRFTNPGQEPLYKPAPPGVFISNPNQGFGRGYYGVNVITTGGEVVGELFVSEWSLKTDLGTILLDASKIKSVTFMGPAPAEEPPPGLK